MRPGVLEGTSLHTRPNAMLAVRGKAQAAHARRCSQKRVVVSSPLTSRDSHPGLARQGAALSLLLTLNQDRLYPFCKTVPPRHALRQQDINTGAEGTVKSYAQEKHRTPYFAPSERSYVAEHAHQHSGTLVSGAQVGAVQVVRRVAHFPQRQ